MSLDFSKPDLYISAIDDEIDLFYSCSGDEVSFSSIIPNTISVVRVTGIFAARYKINMKEYFTLTDGTLVELVVRS